MRTSFMHGLTYSGLNALFQAVMIRFDQLMMGDCYQDRPKMAWIVSSVAGTFFGIIAMVGVWIAYSAQTGNTITYVHVADQWEHGCWLVIVGMLTTIVMGCYFHLFKKSEAGDAPDVTTIAMWLATTPIWVTLVTWLVVSTDFRFGPLAGLQLGEVSPLFFLAILMTTFFIIMFDAEGKRVPLTLKRGTVVAVMVTAIASYTVIASAVLYDRDTAELLALQPYYWLGFASGLCLFFSPKTWHEMKEFAPKFRQYWKVIVVAELFGAAVYIFEMYAFWQLSGVLVNLISAGHVIIVFLLGYILTFLGRRMMRGQWQLRWGAVVLAGESLISNPATRSQIWAGGAAVFSLATAILIAGQ